MTEQTMTMPIVGNLAGMGGELPDDGTRVPDIQRPQPWSWFAEESIDQVAGEPAEGSRAWVRGLGGRDDRPSDELVERVRDGLHKLWRPN